MRSYRTLLSLPNFMQKLPIWLKLPARLSYVSQNFRYPKDNKNHVWLFPKGWAKTSPFQGPAHGLFHVFYYNLSTLYWQPIKWYSIHCWTVYRWPFQFFIVYNTKTSVYELNWNWKSKSIWAHQWKISFKSHFL